MSPKRVKAKNSNLVNVKVEELSVASTQRYSLLSNESVLTIADARGTVVSPAFGAKRLQKDLERQIRSIEGKRLEANKTINRFAKFLTH